MAICQVLLQAETAQKAKLVHMITWKNAMMGTSVQVVDISQVQHQEEVAVRQPLAIIII